ncbi:thiamine phosphate synthase [Oceanidesulfovibrio indonesiensis]|uniref:Thiamine-phosphate synthase n=1 Tax=Oceanidesulfovibrio indonesiensis TaxID=54767 RepID=A0A7M3MFW7_9BACT|nr:thiamine phosphate synthase [Oceanidesulfovibrio indonesiensis]TVM17413.1 thiamine phosphate synthase [Oceanidesulfovibrio indonesiensis]
MSKKRDYSVYLVTDRPLCAGRDLLRIIEEAVAGGATIVQLREKDATAREFFELARAAKDLLDRLGVPLIINDRVDVALAVDADGVHVGQKDLPYAEVRKMVGPHKIVGLSVDTVEQALSVPDLEVVPGDGGFGPDYLGVGPVFPTNTKKDTSEVWGLDKLAELRRQTHQKLVGIGGVYVGNAADVIRAGADGVAVVSAICAAESPKQATEELAAAVMLGRGLE